MAKLPGRVGGILVLDAEGLVKLANGDAIALSYYLDAREARSAIVTAATTLTEVLRGSPRDARVHRILNKLTVVPIDEARARAASELLGRTGLSGHQCALDALVAVVALAQQRPVVLLTSDEKNLSQLTYEPERPGDERIAVIHV
jgi:predicted nucleic acid-binding protein